jgi:hypothetical protein
MAAKMVSVNITLRPDAARKAETMSKLKKLGLRDATILEAIGIVTGRVAHEKLEELSRIPEVRKVELDETITIAPPDSPIQ